MMSQNTEILVEHSPICRLCTLEIDANEVSYIYETGAALAENELTLADKINACLPITVSQSDNLPKQICSSCKEQLEFTYNFSQSVTSAQDIIINLQFSSSSSSEKVNCPLCCCGCMEVTPVETDIYSLDDNDPNQSKNCLEENSQQSIEGVSLYKESLNQRKRGRPKKESFTMQNKAKCSDDNVNPGKKQSVLKGQKKVSKNKFFNAKKMDCFICSMMFRDLNHALVHALSAHCDAVHETFPCPLCQTILSSEKELTVHINSHNVLKEVDTIRCCMCENQNLQTYDIYNHFFEKHMSPPSEVSFGCPVCDQTSEQLNELVTHLVTLHLNEEDTYFACPVCELRQYDEEQFKQHMIENHIIVHNHVRCEVCGHLTECPESNVNHMIEEHCPVETNTVPSFYTCFVCSTSYSTQYQLLKHPCSTNNHTWKERCNSITLERQRKLANERQRRYMERLSEEKKMLKRIKDKERYNKFKKVIKNKECQTPEEYLGRLDRMRKLSVERQRRRRARMTEEEIELKKTKDRLRWAKLKMKKLI